MGVGVNPLDNNVLAVDRWGSTVPRRGVFVCRVGSCVLGEGEEGEIDGGRGTKLWIIWLENSPFRSICPLLRGPIEGI